MRESNLSANILTGHHDDPHHGTTRKEKSDGGKHNPDSAGKNPKRQHHKNDKEINRRKKSMKFETASRLVVLTVALLGVLSLNSSLQAKSLELKGALLDLNLRSNVLLNQADLKALDLDLGGKALLNQADLKALDLGLDGKALQLKELRSELLKKELAQKVLLNKSLLVDGLNLGDQLDLRLESKLDEVNVSKVELLGALGKQVSLKLGKLA